MNGQASLSRQQRNQQQRRRLAGFTLVWLITLALVYFGHRYVWGGTQWLTAVMVGLNVIAGAAMMWANKKNAE